MSYKTRTLYQQNTRHSQQWSLMTERFASISLTSSYVLRARLLELSCRFFVVTCISCRSDFMVSRPRTNAVRLDRTTALETSASSCCTMAPLPAKPVSQTTSTDSVICNDTFNGLLGTDESDIQRTVHHDIFLL